MFFAFIPIGNFAENFFLSRACDNKLIFIFLNALPKYSFKMMKTISFVVLLITLLNIGTKAQWSGDENCETLMSEIHITKDEYNDAGTLIRTCGGDVSVTKCEGFCNSQVQPSVITTTGFLKECYCCRESYLKERVVKLSHCYNADGVKLESNDLSTMEIKLREPADCKCYKCGDFSR